MRLRRALATRRRRRPTLAGDPVHDRLEAVGLVDGRRRPGGSRAVRSSPRPVSMFCSGSGVSVPSACSSYSMKTRFQNSRKRSQLAAGRALGLAAAELRAPVVVHLRVGAARPGAADRPEVVATAAGGTIRSGGMPDPLPELDRDLVLAEPELRVAGEDGDPDAVRVELQVLGHELPGELDRAFLEVLAEREVAEHLEEGQVVRRRARPRRCPACGSTSGRSSAAARAAPRARGSTASAAASPRSSAASSGRQARGTSDADGLPQWPFDSKKERKPSRSSAVVRIRRISRCAARRALTARRSPCGAARRRARPRGGRPLPCPPASPRSSRGSP